MVLYLNRITLSRPGETERSLGLFFAVLTLDLCCSPSRRPPAHPAAFRGRRRAESICRDLRFWMLSAPVRAITSTLPLPNGLRAADGKYYWHPDTPPFPLRLGQVCKIVNKKHDGAVPQNGGREKKKLCLVGNYLNNRMRHARGGTGDLSPGPSGRGVSLRRGGSGQRGHMVNIVLVRYHRYESL